MIRGEVFAEDEADFRTWRAFVWRLLRDVGAPWVRDALEERPQDTMASQIVLAFTPLKSIASALVDIGARSLQGHFDGKPGEDGAAQARNAWHLLRKRNEALSDDAALDFAFVLRDADSKAAERRSGLDQAMRATRGSSPCARPQLLTGLAITEREAWVLATFVARDEQEREALKQEQARTKLRLDTDLHELVNASLTHDRDNKRVCTALMGDSQEAHEERIVHSSLDVIVSRGASTGLTDALSAFAHWLLLCHGELVERSAVERWFPRTSSR